jgi:thiol-disulfide isomerase/thioredoxin
MQYCIATRFSFAVFLTRPRRRGDRVRSSSSGGTDMEPYTHVESVEMWEEILEDAGNALVVVDFWATWWCVRCLRHGTARVASVHCAPHYSSPVAPLAAERELAKVEDRRLDHRLV